MHLLQMAMEGLPTLLGVRVAIVRKVRGACGSVERVLLEKLLASDVCVCCDEEERTVRQAGEILTLPEGEEFFVWLLYKRFINTVCCHAGRAHAARMLPPREVNPPSLKLESFSLTCKRPPRYAVEGISQGGR